MSRLSRLPHNNLPSLGGLQRLSGPPSLGGLPVLLGLSIFLGLAFLGLAFFGAGNAEADDDAAARRKKSGHADLVFDRYEHDFGQVKQLESLTTTFTYTNAGSEPIAGIRVRGECGCNRMELSHKDLQPGESGTLDVEFQTGTLGGFLRKRLHISTADYSRGTVVIPLKIAIVKGLILSAGGVSYRNVLVGTKPTQSFHVNWYEGAGEPFQITKVRVPGFDFDTRVIPYEVRKDPKWRGYSVEVTFKETPPLGMFSAEVRVNTSDPARPELTLPLSANICGKIYMQSRYLSFGRYDHGQEKTASLKFRPFDKSIEFGKVSAKSRSGNLAVEVKPDPHHAKAGYWRLYATVPATRLIGGLEDEVIELHTGVPGEELTLISVRGTVSAPRERKGEGAGR